MSSSVMLTASSISRYLCWCFLAIVFRAIPVHLQSTGSIVHADEVTMDMLLELRSDMAELKKVMMDLVSAQSREGERSADSTIRTGCTANFTSIAGLNGCYRFQADLKEWVNADLLCKTFHKEAHLVFINSADEETAIRNVISDTPCSSPNDAWWIGGQRINPSSKSTFVWKSLSTMGGCSHDRIEPMMYTDWWRDDPNYGAADSPESCVLFWHRDRSLPHQWVVCPAFDSYVTCVNCEVSGIHRIIDLFD